MGHGGGASRSAWRACSFASFLEAEDLLVQQVAVCSGRWLAALASMRGSSLGSTTSQTTLLCDTFLNLQRHERGLQRTVDRSLA
ncbi:MAG TPA: hypothetical protein DEV93_16760 [Chloroflexi bacterium]|nr:hypothetical protein [Chloroflexota bacterium]